MIEIDIYRREIPASERGARRDCEREAVAALVARAFGDGTVLDHTPEGAPYIASRPGVHVSVSHSRGECVLAVSAVEVGVDLEEPREQLARVAGKFLTPEEKGRGELSVEDLARYWSAKEAVFKCAGISDLVISEIKIDGSMKKATARGEIFSIFFAENFAPAVLAIAVKGAENGVKIGLK
ncbi:MAG: 4'-phosphopantetheinyl transferase superfamily protein [Paenibacillus sp.]|nr:4'-phosphopantetheinyl transferase superfamily protein [Paenibacillus sp.]